jgi:heterotetrameric sarcosine oxidase gamma subunit
MESKALDQAAPLIAHAALELRALQPVRWLQLAWNRRQALEAFSSRLSSVLGHLVPLRPNTVSGHPDGPLILWDGPGRWLVRGAGEDLPRKLQDTDLVDISDSLSGFNVSGELALELIASGCPLDMDEQRLEAPACARSMYQHVPLLLFRDGETSIDLYVPASFRLAFAEALTTAARALIALNRHRV